MNKEIKQHILMIAKAINPNIQNYEEIKECKLISDTLNTAQFIKYHLDRLYEFYDNELIKKSAWKEIQNCVFPIDPNSIPKLYGNNLWDLNMWIKHLINKLKEDSPDLQTLNKKWCNKWLFFNGYESGSIYLYIKYFGQKYNGNLYEWYGNMIRTEEQGEKGVLISHDTLGTFKELPYYKNAYDLDDGINPNWDTNSIEYIDKWLELAKIVSEEEIKNDILDSLNYGLESINFLPYEAH